MGDLEVTGGGSHRRFTPVRSIVWERRREYPRGNVKSSAVVAPRPNRRRYTMPEERLDQNTPETCVLLSVVKVPVATVASRATKKRGNAKLPAIVVTRTCLRRSSTPPILLRDLSHTDFRSVATSELRPLLCYGGPQPFPRALARSRGAFLAVLVSAEQAPFCSIEEIFEIAG